MAVQMLICWTACRWCRTWLSPSPAIHNSCYWLVRQCHFHAPSSQSGATFTHWRKPKNPHQLCCNAQHTIEVGVKCPHEIQACSYFWSWHRCRHKRPKPTRVLPNINKKTKRGEQKESDAFFISEYVITGHDRSGIAVRIEEHITEDYHCLWRIIHGLKHQSHREH